MIPSRMIVGLAGAACIGTAASSAVLTVDATGTGEYATIQNAVTAAVDGDVVELSDGTFVGAGNRDVDTQAKAITIRSASGDPAACVIDCQGTSSDPHRAFSITSGEGTSTRVEGIGIQGGFHTTGGAILAVDSTPTIIACLFLGNEASAAGGAVAIDRTGGGPSGSLIADCRFEDNRASGGGALFSWGAIEITNCEFRGNVAANGGGAISTLEAAEATISDCVIVGNNAGHGGGIAAVLTIGSVARSTLSGNRADDQGGGISTSGTVTRVELTQSILWGNCAGVPSTNEGSLEASTFLNAECSVVDLSGVAGDGQYGDNGSKAFVDPLFCDPPDCANAPTTAGDYRVGASSVCLPANSPCGALIGALGEGCSGPTPTVETSWSAIKDQYRGENP